MNKKNMKRVLALFMSVVLIVTGIKLTNRETYAADYQTAPGDENTIAGSYYDLKEYSEDDILGAAQHFLLFGKESATIGTHTNGNIASPTLNTLIDTAGGSFVMNGMKELGYVIPNGNYRLISYIGNAVSDSNSLGTKGNAHLLVVDGTKSVLSNDKRSINGKLLADDFTNVLYENPNVAFIDFDKEFAHFERLSQKLVDFQGNQHKTRADVIEGDGQLCTLTVGNGVTVLSLTADDLRTNLSGSIRKDFHLIGIQSQGQLTDGNGQTHQVVSSNQVVIINVDLAGETDYEMIHDVKFRFENDELVANSEGALYNGTNIIWNFYDSSEADKLYRGQITTSGYTMGVLLAPAASIRAHASNGTVIGTNVTTYQGECHRCDFLPKSIPGLKLYTITYDKNADDAYLGSGDTAVTDATVYEYNKPATIKGNNDTSTPGNWHRTGYKFLGWSENASDTTPTYTAGDTIKMNSDKKLYAIWEALPQYKVTYYKTIPEAIGSQTDSLSPYYSGSTVTVLDQGTMTATDYMFLGWNPSEAEAKKGNVDTNYDPADTFTITKDTDLYAVWSKIPSYKVTYYKTIEDASPAPVDNKSPYRLNSTVTVLGAGAMKADGYVFKGWNPDETAAKAGTVDANYDPADTFTITKDVDLYAVWEKLPQYTVTYHPGINLVNGTAPVDAKSPYYANSSVTVLDKGTMQAQDGYTFNGWNTNEQEALNGKITYKPGQKFQIQANTDLYGVWAYHPLYKVTYHPTVTLTSGSVPVDTTGYEENKPVTVLGGDSMKADGYKFIGWNPNEAEAKKGNVDPNYDPADTFTITQDTDLYAVWLPYVKVTYHPVITLTSGSAPVDANSPYLKGAEVTVLDQGTMLSNAYDFIGWNPNEAEAKKGKTDGNYDPSDKFTITKDTDLYAVWQPKVTITYVSPITLTSGSVPVDENNPYRQGTSATVKDQGTMVAEGYTFLGWNLEKEVALAGNVDPTLAPGLAVELSKDMVLYAVWEPIPQYDVTYDENLKTASEAPVDAKSPYYENSKVTVLDQGTMTAEGYIFKGWNPVQQMAQDGFVDTAYAPGKQFVITDDITLYAVWEKLPTYKVTYHETLSNASAAPTDVNNPYYQGANVTVLGQGTMKANGYAFKGWNPSENDAKAGIIDPNYDPADKFTITKDTDLYAVWSSTVKVTYHPVITLTSGAAPVDSKSPYAVGSTVTVLDKGTMVADGYVFKGWNPSEDAAKAGTVDTNYDPADTFSIKADTDLYAVWVPQVKVTYHPVITLTSGTAPVDANNPYLAGDTVTVLDEGTMVADGYVFLGWNPNETAAKAGTVDANYDPTDTFTIQKDTDLYAVWVPRVKVTYHPVITLTSGAAPVDANSPYFVNSTVTVLDQGTMVADGYVFKGWNLDETAAKAGTVDTNYDPADTFTIKKNTDLYAVWEPKVKVTYHPTITLTSGAAPVDSKSPYVKGSTVTVLKEGTMVADGYVFLGWNPDATAAKAGTVDTSYDPADTFTITQDTDLYAVWKKYYTVGYDPVGGSGEPTDTNKYFDGDKVQVPSGEPKKDGHRFDGWTLDPSDSTAPIYKTGDSVTVNGKDIVFTAIWTKIGTPSVVYKVSYDPNGGVPTPEDTTDYDDGATVIITSEIPVYDGYTFAGWSQDPTDPTMPVLKAGDNTTKIQGSNILFIAVWTPNYNVTYNKNAFDATGTQKDLNNPYESGETVTVLGPGSIVRSGYVFMGWNTDDLDATAGVVEFKADDTFTITNDTELYAVWKKVYIVGYDPNGGSGEPTDANKYFDGDEVTVPSDVPTKNGFEFKGWSLNPDDASAPLYQVGDTVTVNGKDITFTAIWSKVNDQPIVVYSVTYDPAGGVPTPEDTTEYVDGATVIVTDEVPAKDGFTFVGWSLNPSDPNAKLLKGGDSTTIQGSDITFTAIWTPHYVVIYDKNADDATGAQKDINNPYESGETVTVLGAGEIARVGYVFKGWATTASDTTVAYTEGNTFVITADTTLYAVWEALPTFKVVYNPNGGSGEPTDDTKYKDGETVTVSATVPVKDGYIFDGWTLDPADSSAKLLKGGDTTTIQGSDVTFTAVWKADPNKPVVVLYKVTYDPQGGTPTPTDTTEYVDGATVIVTSDVPVKDGYVLDGWTLDPNAATPVLLAGGATTKIQGSDLTIYAVWAPVYTVDYSADGASSTPKDAKKYRNGEKATVVKDIPVVEGKTFKGWTTDPANVSSLLQNGDTVTIEGKNITLYAVFEAIASSTFTVKYDLNGGAGNAPVDPNKYEIDSSVSIVRDVPQRDGYTFTGWSLKSDGSATYHGGDSYKISTDTTFYAIWTPAASGAKTGDPMQVLPWLLVALLSMAGASAAVIRGKKRAK